MKKKLSYFKMVVITMSVSLLLILSCSGKGSSANYYDASYNDAPAASMMRYASEMDDRETSPQSSELEAANLTNSERKLVKRANVRIRVENLEIADASISGLLLKYNAYTASTNIEEKSRFYSMRVPAQYYDIFLSDMNGMGKLLQRRESTEDVTLRYYDLEGRLSTKKELLKTFQSYLGKAGSIEEILAVEARIAELQYDIDGTGIQLRNLANQVDYSTIELSLLGPIATTTSQGLTLGERIKQLFNGFGDFLSTVAVIIIVIVVYGIPVLLILGILFWLFFGRIGLLKKLWFLVKGKKQVN